MRKLLVVLLVIGLLVGAVGVIAGMEDDESSGDFSVWNEIYSPDPGVSPCGGGNGSGGVPG
jgi:hypothetical protein